MTLTCCFVPSTVTVPPSRAAVAGSSCSSARVRAVVDRLLQAVRRRCRRCRACRRRRQQPLDVRGADPHGALGLADGHGARAAEQLRQRGGDVAQLGAHLHVAQRSDRHVVRRDVHAAVAARDAWVRKGNPLIRTDGSSARLSCARICRDTADSVSAAAA